MTREEAIKNIKKLIGFSDTLDESIFTLFPEPAESEDERIIRFFAELATNACGGPAQEYYEEFGLNYDKVMTWLGKQKESPKSADSIPSDCISDAKGVYKICPRCKERMVRDDSKVYTSMPPQYGYECPKCGEIEFDTAMYDNPEMEEQKPVDDKAFEEWIDGWYNEHHRDGYITMDEREFKNFCRGIRNMYQQKLAEWSKNDTVFLNEITDFFENKTVRLQHDLDMYAHWLKSLPERFNLQSKKEWSEDDERRRDGIIQWLREYQKKFNPEYDNLSIESIESLIAWFKSLRPQPKQEWCDDIIRRGIKEVGLTQL